VPEETYARLPRVRRLGKRQGSVALALVEWRQRLAREIDKPAGWILPDHVLVEVARRQPDSRKGLEEVRGMPGQTLQRWQRELLEAVERGKEGPPPPELAQTDHGDSGDAPLVALGQALVRQRALEAKVAVDLVSSQADIAALVTAVRHGRDHPDVRTLDGWRRELVGDELVNLLEGRCLLRVSDGRLTVEPHG